MSKKIGIMPIGDKVLIQEVKESHTKTKSGIILPDAENKDMKKGKVIAVGSGRYEDGDLIPMTVKVGDTVLYGWGEKLVHEGEEYVILNENAISAIIK
jgi:chaperonin GroES